MRRRFLLLLPLLGACLSSAPEARDVRITSNPDVVRPCQFKGNVRAMSSWGSGGVGSHNIEETLKERAHELGANVVYVVSRTEGGELIGSASGEAYLCPDVK